MPRSEWFKKWNRLRYLLYRTIEYRNFLDLVKMRAGYKCEHCGELGQEVHHIVKVYDEPSLALEESNGEFLCKKHHKMRHKGD